MAWTGMHLHILLSSCSHSRLFISLLKVQIPDGLQFAGEKRGEKQWWLFSSLGFHEVNVASCFSCLSGGTWKVWGKGALGRHEEVDEAVVGLWGRVRHVPILEERRAVSQLCTGSLSLQQPGWEGVALCPSPLCLITVGVVGAELTNHHRHFAPTFLGYSRVPALNNFLLLYQPPVCKGCCNDF